MSAAALKRLEAWLAGLLPELARYEYERGRLALDIRAMTRLAKRVAELERNTAHARVAFAAHLKRHPLRKGRSALFAVALMRLLAPPSKRRRRTT